VPSRPTRSNRAGRSGIDHSALSARAVIRVDPDFGDEFPDGDPSSTEAHATIVRLGQALLAEVERHADASHGISQTAVNALAVIDGNGGPITPSDISGRLLVPSATMTTTLDQLEDRGWITRSSNPADRRSVLVETTAEGRRAVDQILAGIASIQRATMSTLTEKERRRLFALLAKVADGAAKVAAEDPTPLAGPRNRPTRLG
jgi:DNA-binding MarR family transcriptional regulator